MRSLKGGCQTSRGEEIPLQLKPVERPCSCKGEDLSHLIVHLASRSLRAHRSLFSVELVQISPWYSRETLSLFGAPRIEADTYIEEAG